MAEYTQLGQFMLGAVARHHREGRDMSEIVTIGHNRDTIDFAREAMNNVSFWLRENPVIADPVVAKQANDILASALLTLKDLDDQRKEQTEPLNRQLGAINAVYRAVRVPFEHAIDELKRRLFGYVDGEEKKREAEAARLRAVAEEAEQRAREAERIEQEAMANAREGECTDVGGAIEQAEAAFGDFTAAERAATIAERDAKLRLRSRFDARARTIKTREALEVTDACAAIGVMGVSERLSEAICAEARAYRKATGRLPPGIVSTQVRSL